MKDQEMQIVLPANPVPGIIDPHMEAPNSGVFKMNYCDCDGHNEILAKLEKFDEVQHIDRDAEPHKVLIFITRDPRKVTNLLKNRNQKFEYFEKSPSMNNPEMPLVIPPKEAPNSGVFKMNYCDCDGHNEILAKLEKFDEVQHIDRDAEPHKVLIFITGDPRKVTNLLKNRNQKFEYFEKSPSMNNPEMPLVIPPKPFQVVAGPPGYGFTGIPLEDLKIDETIVTDQARSTRHASKRHRAQQTCQSKCTRMQGDSLKVHKTEPLRPILKTAQSTETKTAKHVPRKKVSFAPELETYWDLSKTVWKGEMPSQKVAK